MTNIDYSLLKEKFITFEGPEGSGKTTQIRKLSDELKNKNLNVILTREPGGTPVGDQIRKILLDPKNIALVSTAELILYQAARSQHLGELIYPGIASGALILCDRFSDATKAYQGYGRGLDFKLIDESTDLAITIAGKKIMPNLTLLLDIDAKIGLERARGRESVKASVNQETRFENEALQFHERVRRGYLDMAKNEPARFRIIDASGTPEKINLIINKTLDEYLINL